MTWLHSYGESVAFNQFHIAYDKISLLNVTVALSIGEFCNCVYCKDNRCPSVSKLYIMSCQEPVFLMNTA